MERKEGLVIGATLALVLYTISLCVLGPVVSAVISNRTLSNVGSIKAIGVGVYWDQACVSPVSSINWGVIEPGSNVDKTIYIRNEGNAAASLSVATSNWSPSSASSYLTLSWDYGGQSLGTGEVVQVKFTLSASPDTAGITSFSFDITITANG